MNIQLQRVSNGVIATVGCTKAVFGNEDIETFVEDLTALLYGDKDETAKAYKKYEEMNTHQINFDQPVAERPPLPGNLREASQGDMAQRLH